MNKLKIIKIVISLIILAAVIFAIAVGIMYEIESKGRIVKQLKYKEAEAIAEVFLGPELPDYINSQGEIIRDRFKGDDYETRKMLIKEIIDTGLTYEEAIKIKESGRK